MTARAQALRVRRRNNPFGARVLGPREQSPRALRIRVQLLLTAVLLTTNLVGAVIVLVISAFVVPGPPPNSQSVVALAIAVPTYVVAAALAGTLWGTAATLRALRWATQDLTPEPGDRTRTLRVPLRLTLMQLVLWLAASLLFTLLAVALQPARALSTGLTVGIAGLVVCGISYLLSEFALRPIAARALVDAPVTGRLRGAGVGARMVIFWAVGTAAPVTGLVVAGILTLAGSDTTRRELATVAIVTGSAALVFGLLVMVLNARAVVAPILSVRDALQAVERGDLDVDVVVWDGTELGQLQSGFNRMVHGLRERELIRDLFGRHVGHEVASAAASLGEVELGGETRVVSVLFVDLVGSTTYATEHPASDVVAVLNRFFGVVVDEVDRHQGLVNKFIGDAVLAVFGAPVALDDHAAAALATARAMAERLAVEVPEIGAGIGVATGAVVAGNVGHEERYEYTVLGDAVNSAARLTDLAKEVPGRVLAAGDAVDAARSSGEAGHWTSYGETVLRGRSEPTRLAVPTAAASS